MKCVKLHIGDLWGDDRVQFARLLCEIAASCDDLRFGELEDSMGLGEEDVNELFERAHQVWEEAKASKTAWLG